jgi:transmembrane 9 superfamily protein 2/4
LLVFAMLGMLSPASRGALMTAAIFLYVFMGLIAGYHSGRLYKTMKGKEWKRAAFLVSDLNRLAALVIIIIRNLIQLFNS